MHRSIGDGLCTPNEAHFRAPKEMAETSTLTIATWNVEWATPGSDRGSRCAAVLADARADISVVTEAFGICCPRTATPSTPAQTGGIPKARKAQSHCLVALSTHPGARWRCWCHLWPAGDGHRHDPRTRRFASSGSASPGTRPTCAAAGVMPSRGRSTWTTSTGCRACSAASTMTCLPWSPGTSTSAYPCVRQPIRVFDRLREVLSGWTIHTAGAQPNGPHIDHIATNRKLTAEQVHDWAAADHLGRLSDHAGVSCRLADAGEAAGPVTTSDTVTSYSQPEQENHTMATDDSHREFDLSASDPVMTPQLRAEIEGILRRTPGGFEHGLGFQLRERGLNDNEIINMGSEIGTSDAG